MQESCLKDNLSFCSFAVSDSDGIEDTLIGRQKRKVRRCMDKIQLSRRNNNKTQQDQRATIRDIATNMKTR